MKSLRNKVILSAIVLVFAVIATIGSTYAWFTVSNIVTVNSFDVTVESSEALLMRVWDGETDEGTAYNSVDYNWTLDDFSNTLDLNDSDQYNGTTGDLSAWRLSPVTCLTGETAGTTGYTGTDVTALRKPTSTFLTPDATSSGVPGRTLGTANAAENTAGGGYIKLQFWMLKPAGDSTNVALDYTITDGNASQDWEQSIWIGTYFSDTSTQNIFGEDLDLGFTWATAAVPGYSSSGALNSMSGTASVTAATQGTTVIGTIPTANIPELLTVYIWAEGWDADTTNDIMSANFSLTLTFTLIGA